MILYYYIDIHRQNEIWYSVLWSTAVAIEDYSTHIILSVYKEHWKKI